MYSRKYTDLSVFIELITAILSTHFCRIRDGGGEGCPPRYFLKDKTYPTNYTSLEREFIEESNSF